MSNTFIHTYPPKRKVNNSFSDKAGSFASSSNSMMTNSNIGTDRVAGGSFASSGTPNASPAFLSQPIRVTPNTVESLMYALAHTVEFQRTLNSPVAPADVVCDSLGGVVYSACTQHHDSMIKQLPAAVQKAKALLFTLGSGDAAGALFCLRIKVIKSVDKKSGFAGLWSGFNTKEKSAIEEWEFLILKQQHDTLIRGGGGKVTPGPASGKMTPQPGGGGSGQQYSSTDTRGSSGPLQLDSNNNSRGFSPESGSGGGGTAPQSNSNTQYRFHADEPLNFCNDPRQVRDALMFVVTKSFEAIDSYVAKDFSTADELLFEVTVEEKSSM